MPYGSPASAGLRAFDAVINGDMRVSQAGNAGVQQIQNIGVFYNGPDMSAWSFDIPAGAINIQNISFAAHPILGTEGFCSRNSMDGSAVVTAGNANYVTRTIFVSNANFQAMLEQDCTMQFWARTSFQTGNYYLVYDVGVSGDFADGAKFIQRYNITQLNTWQQFKFPIKFEATILAPWIVGPTVVGRALAIRWPLVVGTLRRGGPSDIGTWLNPGGGGSSLLGDSDVKNFSGSAATFDITDISLTIGAGSLPFYRPEFSESLQISKQYYQQTFPYGQPPGTGLGAAGVFNAISYRPAVGGVLGQAVRHQFEVEMASLPAVTFFNPVTATANWRNATLAADSGAATIDASLSNTKAIFALNPQVVGDAAGNIINVGTSFNSRMT